MLNSEKFEKYFELLVEYNAKFNLTTIVEREQVYKKHFEDSLLGVDLVPQNSHIVDIGCGAGFPSLPLVLQRGDIKATLCDSVRKKLDFVDVVVNELGLQGRVQTIHARAEDIKQREFFDCCVCRAVARLNTLAELTLPFVKVGGLLLCYKANDIEQEIGESKHAIKLLGGQIEDIKEFDLDADTKRKIVVVRKISATDRKYPRGKNQARTNPL